MTLTNQKGRIARLIGPAHLKEHGFILDVTQTGRGIVDFLDRRRVLQHRGEADVVGEVGHETDVESRAEGLLASRGVIAFGRGNGAEFKRHAEGERP